MGTNYYAQINPCPSCGRPDDTLHIGKSSAGWVFSLNTHPEHGIESLQDWFDFLADKEVRDEYGQRVSIAKLHDVITKRHFKGATFDDRWLDLNHAQPGPNRLARHKIDGRHCIAHGDGTYDLMHGDFS